MISIFLYWSSFASFHLLIQTTHLFIKFCYWDFANPVSSTDRDARKLLPHMCSQFILGSKQIDWGLYSECTYWQTFSSCPKLLRHTITMCDFPLFFLTDFSRVEKFTAYHLPAPPFAGKGLIRLNSFLLFTKLFLPSPFPESFMIYPF